MLALFAVDLSARDMLVGNAVVVTVMTNLGFRLAMAERASSCTRPRSVTATCWPPSMRWPDPRGEQSGHIVFRHIATTGDGCSPAWPGRLICRSGLALSELSAGLVERVPQVLVNVPVLDPGGWERPRRSGNWCPRWRPSSATRAGAFAPEWYEPLVRVMVEAKSAELAADLAVRLSAAVEAALGPDAP